MISALVARAVSSPSAMFSGVAKVAMRLKTGSAHAGKATDRASVAERPRRMGRMGVPSGWRSAEGMAGMGYGDVTGA